MAENEVSGRQYTKEFKVEVMWLAESVRQHEGAGRPGMLWRRRLTGTASSAMAARRPQLAGDERTVSSRRPVSDPEAESSRQRKELAGAHAITPLLRLLRLLRCEIRDAKNRGQNKG